MTETLQKKPPYKLLDALDKTYKPLVIDWLCALSGYDNYPHDHTDQWIQWNIWDGELTVMFDLRIAQHKKLLSLIHPRFLGCPQQGTLKIVNEQTFYLSLDRFIRINYPEITRFELLKRVVHKDDGDDFFTYDWEVFLNDGTSIEYHGYEPKMDLKKGDFVYNKIIQERAFTNYLKPE